MTLTSAFAAMLLAANLATPLYAVHSKNLALLALLTSVVLLASCAAQLLLRRGAPPAATQAGGLTLLAAGLAALVVASPARSWVLLVVGAALAGAGHGAAYLAAQDDLTRIAPRGQRAEMSAAFYVCIYLGVSLPVIGIGILADFTTLFTAVTAFAVVTGAGALTVAGWHLSRRDGDTPGTSARPSEETRRTLREAISGSSGTRT